MYGYQQLTRNKDATYFTAITKAKKSKTSKIQLIQQKRRYACPPDSFLDLAKFSYLELDLGYSKMLDFEATFEMLAKLPGLQVLSLVKCHSITFPKNIEKLTNLKTLWIRNNEFEVMPEELANLEKLEELNARSCAMKQFPKPVLELKKLKKLTLSNNKFAALPDELFELTNLEYLDIGTCGLTKISEKIGQLKNLKTLILDKNKLTKLPKVLFKMPKLEKISIVGNRNLDLVEYFKLLEKLGTEELNFADFGKIKAIPKEIENLKKLKTLNLKNCGLSTLPKEIGHLEKLETIDLTQNKFEEIPESVLELKHLKQLFISHNQLQTIPKNIDKLVSLEQFDFSQNQLSTLPQALKNLKKIQSFRAYGNPNLDTEKHKKLLTPMGEGANYQISRMAQFPKNWDELAEIDTLTIHGNQDIEKIPKEIGQLTNLKSLNIRHGNNLTEIPEEIGQLKNLENLMIYYCPKMEQLPNFFDSFPKLERLNIYLHNIKKLPDSVFKCTALKTFFFTGQAPLLPDSFENLTNLEHFAISNDQIETLPDSFANCKNINQLNIYGSNFNLRKCDSIFKELSNLESFLFQTKNPEIDLTALLQLPQLQILTLNLTHEKSADLEPHIEVISQLKNLNQLAITIKDAALPANIGEIAFIEKLQLNINNYSHSQLLRFPLKMGLAKNNIPEFWVNNPSKKLIDDANDFIEKYKNVEIPDEQKIIRFAVWTNNISELQNELPKVELTKNDVFFISGRMEGTTKKEIQEKLNGIGAKLANKLDNKVTKVVITKTTKQEKLTEIFDENYDIITPDQFKAFIWENDTPYMMEADSEDMTDQIMALFLSEEETNFQLALELIEGGGATKKTISCLLATMLFNPDTVVRRKARSLFKVYAPSNLKEFVKAKWKSNYRKRLPYDFMKGFMIHDELDKFAFFLVKQRNQIMEGGNTYYQKEWRETLRLDFDFEEFSEDILLWKGLRKIIFDTRSQLNLKQILPMLSKFSQLEAVYFNHQPTIELTEEIYELKNLKTLQITGHLLTQLPQQNSGKPLPHLQNLTLLFQAENPNLVGSLDLENFPNLADLKLQGIPENKVNNLDKLQNLKTLFFMRAGLKNIPTYLASMKHLVTMNFDFNQISVIPKEIIEKQHFQLLTLNYNEFKTIPFEIFWNKINFELALIQNKITELPKELFEKFPNQWVLRIGKNPIKSIPEHFPEHFKVTDSNNYLRIYYPHNLGIPYQKIQQLREAYPRLVLLT